MSRISGRKPIGNFFIKKSMQIETIVRITVSVILATVLSSGIIVATYYLQHKSINLYKMTEVGNLSKENILTLILPSLAISIVVNGIMGLLIAFYASRRHAVPIYKLEQWARSLMDGKFNMTLKFREEKQMNGLSEHFNQLTTELRFRFLQMQTLVDGLHPTEQDKESVKEMHRMLEKLDLDVTEGLDDERAVKKS